MTRKRRKTRSRQERRRIHERTRQTYDQAVRRYFEAQAEAFTAMLERPHPFATLMAQRGHGPLATHNRWI